MLAATRYGDVTQIRLCRYTDFRPGTYVSVYLVDHLLVDSGPAHTAEELANFLKDKQVKTVVNTHHHAESQFLQRWVSWVRKFEPPNFDS